MLHILFMILKVLGILLAVILGLLLFLLLAVLFVPITYRVDAAKQEKDYSAKVGVFWLGYLLGVVMRFSNEKESETQIYLLGIPIKRLALWLKKHLPKRKKKSPKKRNSENKESTDLEELTDSEENFSKENAENSDSKVNSESEEPTDGKEDFSKESAENPDTKVNPKSEKPADSEENTKTSEEKKSLSSWIKKFFDGLRFVFEIPEKLWNICRNIHFTRQKLEHRIKAAVELLKSPEFQEAKTVIFQKLGSILKHLKPRRVKGNVVFGFDDPSLTGRTLAGISMCYPILPKKLQITPVFDRAILEGELRLNGHLILGLPVLWVLQVYLNRSVQTMIEKFKKKK